MEGECASIRRKTGGALILVAKVDIADGFMLGADKAIALSSKLNPEDIVNINVEQGSCRIAGGKTIVIGLPYPTLLCPAPCVELNKRDKERMQKSACFSGRILLKLFPGSRCASA